MRFAPFAIAVAGCGVLCYTHADFSLKACPFGRAESWITRPEREVPRKIEGADVSGSASISTGIAMRYATAVFELAKEDGNLEMLEADIAALDTALNRSEDMRMLIRSPVYTREEQAGAITAIAKGLELSGVFTNTLGLMASKRRLFILPALLEALSALLADEKGEITAEVVAAKAMTKSQQEKLAKSLKATVGKDVKISLAVDANLIGGLIVKLGSKMIDTSIRAKLANLQNAMKEVG